MRLSKNCYLSLKDYLMVIENLWNRITEMKDDEVRNYYFEKVNRHLRSLVNMEEFIVDELWKEDIRKLARQQ
jgi:hypothetical protein